MRRPVLIPAGRGGAGRAWPGTGAWGQSIKPSWRQHLLASPSTTTHLRPPLDTPPPLLTIPHAHTAPHTRSLLAPFRESVGALSLAPPDILLLTRASGLPACLETTIAG